EGDADAADLVRLEVGDETGPGLAQLLDREDDPGLRIVVVVADGDGPRHRREVGVVGDHRVEVVVERMVVDRSAHAVRQAQARSSRRNRQPNTTISFPSTTATVVVR